MLGHDYVAINVQPVTPRHPLQGGLEDAPAFIGGKKGMAVITAECDEMTLTVLVKASQPPRHENNVAFQLGGVCDV
jgi:hypothetical protein